MISEDEVIEFSVGPMMVLEGINTLLFYCFCGLEYIFFLASWAKLCETMLIFKVISISGTTFIKQNNTV